MGQQKTQTAGCAACNHMHHRCLPNCIFAPYFPATNPSFSYISQVYSLQQRRNPRPQGLTHRTHEDFRERTSRKAEARIRNPSLDASATAALGSDRTRIQEINEAQFSAANYQPPLEQQYWHQMTTMTAQSYHEQPDDFPTQPDFQTQSYHEHL
ncbi:protein LATERAL ORGAN BOUNDARIES-like [Zingiber officinale]|uniref:protein LATERAL ORGAN BOUNDARIES-like n=1 Tax=Zingiber officinale TaxID=94328 RepID=UPI001C4D7788|nr:protein LATERAL ORGAN BOUNDARIES-like [Zingiber officinale]